MKRLPKKLKRPILIYVDDDNCFVIRILYPNDKGIFHADYLSYPGAKNEDDYWNTCCYQQNYLLLKETHKKLIDCSNEYKGSILDRMKSYDKEKNIKLLHWEYL